MSTSKDGGPAFPVPIQKHQFDTLPEHFRQTGTQGMTLRDWFAGQALANMVQRADLGHSLHNANVCINLAKSCYCLADAMLAAREKDAQ